MSLAASVKSDIKLEAVNVYWGTEKFQNVTFVDDSSGSLTDEYFDINTIGSDLETETKYYVLFSGTTPAVDPAPTGKTKIEVTYADDDTAATIAGLFVTALAAVDVTATQDGAEVLFEGSRRENEDVYSAPHHVAEVSIAVTEAYD